MTEPHTHIWRLPDTMIVIDTYPPTYTYLCECGARTHDPETQTANECFCLKPIEAKP